MMPPPRTVELRLGRARVLMSLMSSSRVCNRNLFRPAPSGAPWDAGGKWSVTFSEHAQVTHQRGTEDHSPQRGRSPCACGKRHRCQAAVAGGVKSKRQPLPPPASKDLGGGPAGTSAHVARTRQQPQSAETLPPESMAGLHASYPALAGSASGIPLHFSNPLRATLLGSSPAEMLHRHHPPKRI